VDIEDIKREWYAGYSQKPVVMIIAEPEGFFTVYQHSDGGVAPPSQYQTAAEAIARVAQLHGLKESIAPQSWPERVEVGSIGARRERSDR
jgi:hypothetical protein